MSINLYILNATGRLDKYIRGINDAFGDAKKIASEQLSVDDVDIVFRDAPLFTIPEVGTGGFTTDDGHCIYLSLNADKGFKISAIYSQLLHELHHAKRFQSLGWPQDLAGNLVSEGLACLFEEELTKERPIYTKTRISQKDAKKARKYLFDKNYNHDEWFFGTKDVPLWFGYTYGYQICKEYAAKTQKTSAELVLIPEEKIAVG